MRITVLAGGVGAARFLRGLKRAAPDADITVIGNTGDDITLFGLRVSWGRIEGVSRSLPFSDLLALTSSHTFLSVMDLSLWCGRDGGCVELPVRQDLARPCE